MPEKTYLITNIFNIISKLAKKSKKQGNKPLRRKQNPFICKSYRAFMGPPHTGDPAQLPATSKLIGPQPNARPEPAHERP